MAKTPKPTKPKPENVAAQIQGMQQELVDLQRSLAQLLDALIAGEKPGPREIRKIKSLRDQALKSEVEAKLAQPAKTRPKRKKKTTAEQATFDE